MDRKQAIVIGDANIDLTIWKKKQGHFANAPVQDACGGVGVNTAVALSRLNIPVSLLGMVGADNLGQRIITYLKKEGVDTTNLFSLKNGQTMLVIYAVDEKGLIWNNAVWPELTETALFSLSREYINDEDIKNAAWLHLNGFLLLKNPLREAILTVIKIAGSTKITISIDLNLRGIGEAEPSGFRDSLQEVISQSNYVFGSESDEFNYLYPDLPPEKAAQKIASESRIVIIRKAEKGSIAITNDRIEAAKAFPVNVISPVGAGDTFNAGFIMAKLKNFDNLSALKFGNAAAALKIGRNSLEGPPSYEEVVKRISDSEL